MDTKDTKKPLVNLQILQLALCLQPSAESFTSSVQLEPTTCQWWSYRVAPTPGWETERLTITPPVPLMTSQRVACISWKVGSCRMVRWQTGKSQALVGKVFFASADWLLTDCRSAHFHTGFWLRAVVPVISTAHSWLRKTWAVAML